MKVDWDLDQLNMFRFLWSPTSWAYIDCTQSSAQTLNAQQTQEVDKWIDRSWPDRPCRGAVLMGKERHFEKAIEWKNWLMISISLTAQLPTGKKRYLDKIRKIPFSRAQAWGWRSQGRLVRASNALWCLQPPQHLFPVAYFRCVNVSLQNHIPLLGFNVL